MSSIRSLLDSSLSSTETVLSFVETLSITNLPSIPPQNLEAPENWHDRRVLAAVSHKDDWALTEEGALFVYKFTSPENSAVLSLDVQRIYPIYGNFSIVMGQMRRNTIDLSTANSKVILDQPRSGFSLSVNPAEGLQNGTEAAKFYAADVQSLGILIAECKRLKNEIESSRNVDVEQSQIYFNWLVPYYSRFIHQYPCHVLIDISMPIASSMPPDLRVANKNLLDRLSPASAGFSGNDNADIRLIRDEWVRDRARSLSRQGKRKLSLRLGTFNVNGKLPSQDLSSWIQGVSTSIAEPVNNDPGPDVLALGFQELDLSTEALIYSVGSAREDAWTMAIKAALGEKGMDYEKLTSKQLVGMLIIIFVKKKLKHCFGEVRATAAGSGILGIMGNKGATAVRLVFTPPFNAEALEVEAQQSPDSSLEHTKDTGAVTFTFVNAHMAAFDEMIDRRNQDFHELSKRLAFGKDPDDDDNVFGVDSVASGSINIYETDALFWMGDLNYRVDVPDPDFRDLLKDNEWGDRLQTLIRYDQLKKSIISKKAFECFREHSITFLPTYRFGAGQVMDELGYDQK
ncbi:hypothetical protein AGABI1DRAFT_101055 [Agaricus bisporus var. burnettii JB137-S8]|uniref:Inositol polyphosphate-related phosphatase domain-containing protein n=1 Tax=Agaricus bisporus var. burnettii (strain JB137-S8 / ATCC MYA-4627 / FGSC 10392) TaxID=597362 RepID=K5X5U9_AGABU|nr:uncharacterized protein AGABI1DRAFT_101055 [Agaricus bisporus var. burnettii JB137-S8]EKM78327.1 hypothetical protein AGABI1DRAFT_101055 [Agaricus bisporus var. burnettii JB137-S8]